MEKRFLFPMILGLMSLGYFGVIIIGYEFGPVMHEVTDFSSIIPGGTGTDLIWVAIIAMVGILIPYIIAPYVAVVFLRIHQFIYRKRYQYFRARFQYPKLSGFSIISRSISPSLVAIALGFFFSGLFGEHVYSQGLSSFVIVLSNSLIFGVPISALLFTPLWIFDDYGICTNRNNTKNITRRSPEVHSIGYQFNNILKHYASFLIIVSFVILMITSLNTEYLSSLDVVFFIFFFVPISILDEMTHNHRKKHFLKFMQKYGVNIDNHSVQIEEGPQSEKDRHNY